jgi:dGTP triphosphohydrolase
VRFLYTYFRDHPEEIKSDYVIPDDPPWRQAADYVSGMTDRFALDMAYRLGYRD